VKIAVIGGAGVRVPLLAGGLSRSDLNLSEIALYDIDQDRLRVIASLASQMAGGVKITTTATPEPAIDGSSFVITSIRVGGAGQRAKDEAIALAHDVVGQETIGPAGFAMAVRSIPPIVDYGRMVARLAPRAWMINFTNPVSIITQAVHQETDARLIGICDTPLEMFEDAAHALGLPASVCGYDYFGLNHLGWLRDVLFEGEGQLQRIWSDDAKLMSAYRAPLFEPARLRELKLLPTE
jgi:6-phospho-beta-glucosidase